VFVDHLQLADFRSYGAVDVALASGVSIFVGANGQGKTNLVEAVEYLSTLSSHRVAADLPLVRAGAERAIVRARVQAGLEDPRQLQLEVEITPGRANPG
jgi:DNA replication and repair protein RecF